MDATQPNCSNSAGAVSREHELLHASKHDKLLALDSSGNLKLSKRVDETSCDAGNEILLRNCLVRRALALDQANVVGYEIMDTWTNKLLEVRVADAPAGYSRVSFQRARGQEVIRADGGEDPHGHPCHAQRAAG